MSKNPGTVPFKQPEHGKTGNSSAKNKGTVSFKQQPGRTPAGGTTTKKNPTMSKSDMKTTPMTGNSKAKNPGKVGFTQPSKGGSAKMPKASGENVNAGAKVKSAKNVAPKFKSTDALRKHYKSKYGKA